MIHTASLVHDDVLDESNTRRGEIPLHITTILTHKIGCWKVQTFDVFILSTACGGVTPSVVTASFSNTQVSKVCAANFALRTGRYAEYQAQARQPASPFKLTNEAHREVWRCDGPITMMIMS